MKFSRSDDRKRENRFSLNNPNKATKDKLAAANAQTTRLMKQADALFAVMPSTVAEFDPYTPASWLIRNPKALDGKGQHVTATLDRAQKVFEVYNNLLG